MFKIYYSISTFKLYYSYTYNYIPLVIVTDSKSYSIGRCVTRHAKREQLHLGTNPSTVHAPLLLFKVVTVHLIVVLYTVFQHNYLVSVTIVTLHYCTANYIHSCTCTSNCTCLQYRHT